MCSVFDKFHRFVFVRISPEISNLTARRHYIARPPTENVPAATRARPARNACGRRRAPLSPRNDIGYQTWRQDGERTTRRGFGTGFGRKANVFVCDEQNPAVGTCIRTLPFAYTQRDVHCRSTRTGGGPDGSRREKRRTARAPRPDDRRTTREQYFLISNNKKPYVVCVRVAVRTCSGWCVSDANSTPRPCADRVVYSGVTGPNGQSTARYRRPKHRRAAAFFRFFPVDVITALIRRWRPPPVISGGRQSWRTVVPCRPHGILAAAVQ